MAKHIKMKEQDIWHLINGVYFAKIKFGFLGIYTPIYQQYVSKHIVGEKKDKGERKDGREY